MASFALQNPRHWNNSGAPCQVYTIGGEEQTWVAEAASQTYKKGQMVYFDTSGNVAICGQSSSIMNTEILGFAAQDGENGSVGVPKTRVNVIRVGDILIANLWHSTENNSKANRNQLGDIFGLTLVNPTTKAVGIAATDVFVVDLLNTTTEDATNALARCRVVGFPTNFQGVATTIGTDTYAPVLIQILPYSIATDGSPHTRVLQIL